MQKMVKTQNTQKSTGNLMSSFGLIKENMELSHNDLAVPVLELICSWSQVTDF